MAVSHAVHQQYDQPIGMQQVKMVHQGRNSI